MRNKSLLNSDPQCESNASHVTAFRYAQINYFHHHLLPILLIDFSTISLENDIGHQSATTRNYFQYVTPLCGKNLPPAAYPPKDDRSLK
jgi:hypothetical protein